MIIYHNINNIKHAFSIGLINTYSFLFLPILHKIIV